MRSCKWREMADNARDAEGGRAQFGQHCWARLEEGIEVGDEQARYRKALELVLP